MKKLLFNNTYKSGKKTYLVIKEADQYVGICMEFDLEVCGKNEKEVFERLDDITDAWHENIVKNKLPEELLNKPAPIKYWKLFKLKVEEEIRKLKAQENPSSSVAGNPTSIISYSMPYSRFSFN
ncbi:hypothetical protein A3A63_02390 [Candidatus Gottesmanbacteria bacterium RIFCSPLOWO2_01_FULL_46_9]|uniref:HicB-like antitoxin of toxin-antitoxin system domain-containing protein n=1 Tax=Candidatus Gottesmanbacteria bacterium RIFCSPLOWO2_01_FULL_46_9 TaxID=1798394 RepID=A0A1F6AXN6_9BACT|nr:MAG: hypothetical protein A3A63_02390 [Candidatus Gottesmanbacteria bacterium RIFCSPLOWO2_01_FULL_46_9]